MPGQCQASEGPAAQGEPSRNRSADVQAKIDKLFADLTPVASGTGVIIFEPVCLGADEHTAAFTAGCSRWLQFVVGGQAEIGKTPAWDSIDRVRKELEWVDLRQPANAAARLGIVLGATHVVTGDAKTVGGKLELIYKLHILSGGNPISVVNLSGDEAAIAAALPTAARKLATALGVPNPRLPAVCLAGARGLAAMGKTGYIVGRADTAEEVSALAEVASREPAAATMLLQGDRPIHPDAIERARRTLARLGPDNVIALYTLVGSHAGKLTAVPPDLRKVADAHPNNYNLNAALVGCMDEFGTIKDIVPLSREAVRISPRNAVAWIRLAGAYGNYANVVRLGRVARDITESEWTKLHEIYLVWTIAAKRATELDPRNVVAWTMLSRAACCAGAQELADSAFWKAVDLDSSEPGAISWGLEMFQPKWFDDRQKLDRVVALAVSAEYSSKRNGIQLADRIASVDARYKTDADKLRARMAAEAKTVIARDPSDHEANVVLAKLAESKYDYKEAEQRYLAIVRQNPDDFVALGHLGEIMTGSDLMPEIARRIKDGSARKPDDMYLMFQLGRAQMLTKDFDGALKSLRSIPASAHQYPFAQDLIPDALESAGRLEEAMEWFRAMIRANPGSIRGHHGLIQLLRNSKKDDEALAATRAAKAALPTDTVVRRVLADLLERKGDYAGAVPEWQFLVAREQNPEMRATMGINMGDALAKSNQKADALKAYRTALADKPDGALGDIARAKIAALESGNRSQITQGSVAAKPGEFAPSRISSVQELIDRGKALQNQGKFKESAEQFTAVLKADPRMMQAHYGLGMALLATGKPAEALTELRIAAEGMPNNSDALHYYGISLILNGKPVEALPWLKKAIPLDPTQPGKHQQYIDLLLLVQMPDEALAATEVALKTCPQYELYRSERGRAYEMKGNDSAALEEYKKAYTEVKNKILQAGAHYAAGKLLWKLGRKDEAKSEMQAVIQADPVSFGPGAKQLLESWK